MFFYSQEQYNEYMDELHAPRATPSTALNEYAHNAGMDDPDRAWILTPWDTWESNPFYRGPAVPHPEFGDDFPEAPFIEASDAPHNKEGRRMDWDEIPF